MPIATIIGALITAGAGIAGGVINAKAQKEANQKNVELAMLERSDTQNQLDITNKQNEDQLALQKKQIAFNQQQTVEQKGYDRLQHAADMYADFLNRKTALKQANLTPLMQRAA
jgi:hypothetical protein